MQNTKTCFAGRACLLHGFARDIYHNSTFPQSDLSDHGPFVPH